MKVRILQSLFLIILVGTLATCQKKGNLLDKAFEGKKFGNTLPQDQREPADTGPEADKEDGETKVDVLVDNLEDKSGDTVFLETGREEGPAKPGFPNDPEAVLNFEDAKLYDVIHTLCQTLGVNYLIDPSVKDQTITIGMTNSDNKLTASQLLDIILKLHGLVMVVDNNFVRILPSDSPEVNTGLEILHGSIPNRSMSPEEIVFQIVPLKYVKPSQITSVVTEFLSPTARVLEEPINNVLIIIDQYKYIAKVMNIIPIFDVNIMQSKKIVFYQLAHVDAVETANKLQEILTAYGFTGDDERLSINPIETLNGILVISSTQDIFKELDYWTKKLDKEAQYEEEQVFVYHVQNTTVDNLSQTVAQVLGIAGNFGGGGIGGANPISNRRSTSPNRNAQDPNNQLQQQNQQQSGGLGIGGAGNNQQRAGSQALGGGDQGPLMIIDAANNAMIFRTTQREYARIQKILQKLDILPRQVFLEVTVLSVDLNDNYSFGLDWTADNVKSASESHDVAGGFSAPQGGGARNFGVGYTFTGLTGSITATINAAKSKGYANILQQPHIMAIDNQSASISVGANIPIQTGQTNIQGINDGSAVNPTFSSTIEYQPTGVNLNFTPHINANGVIRLQVSLDISSAGPQSTTAEPVAIQQNTLSTEMIVRDNQTVVMGGLIFDEEGWTKESVPILGKIPLLRHLFTSRSNRATKRELIVMITPRLIDSEEKSIAISQEFKEKVLKEFESFRSD